MYFQVNFQAWMCVFLILFYFHSFWNIDLSLFFSQWLHSANTPLGVSRCSSWKLRQYTIILNHKIRSWRCRKRRPKHFLWKGHSTDRRPASSRHGDTMLYSFIYACVDIQLVDSQLESADFCFFSPLRQTHKDIYFVHIRQGGLYWVATTTAPDSSPFTVIEFLNRYASVCSSNNHTRHLSSACHWAESSHHITLTTL